MLSGLAQIAESQAKPFALIYQAMQVYYVAIVCDILVHRIKSFLEFLEI